MKIISVVSAKGGVGKSTISANLGLVLKSQGHPVVALDFDPQNSLRLHFGIPPVDQIGVAYDSISNRKWSESFIKGAHDCAVLPFGQVTEIERASFEKMLFTNPSMLSQQLQSLGLPTDTIVVIDTPPGPSVYLKQALSVANIVVVVTLADAASYATIPLINGLIEEYCLNRSDFIDYIYVINQLNRTRKLASDVADIMSMQYAHKKIAIVHQDQSIPEALACCLDVMGYAPDGRGTTDLLELGALIKPLLKTHNTLIRM